jgi:hypothetical protein
MPSIGKQTRKRLAAKYAQAAPAEAAAPEKHETIPLDAKPGDRTLWRLVQARLEAGASWEAIAEELGCTWQEIVAWVLAYKEERQRGFANVGARENYAFVDLHDRDASVAANAQRFAIWRKQRDGVRAARQQVEATR